MVEPFISRCLSEFLGTYLLVITVGCNVIDGNPTWAVASIASVLMVLIYALGPVSGAHFNPAVTAAIVISDSNFHVVHAVAYMAVQLLGGIAAGWSYYGIYGKTFYLGPAPGFTWPGAMVAEVAYTAMLCFVVLNVAVAPKTNANNQFFGLAIGFVIMAGGYAAGGISGGAFNPAVAIGIDCVDQGFLGMRWFFAYAGFELFGAVLAAIFFRVVRPAEFDYSFNSSISALVSEFIGTFYLVLTVGLNVLGGSKAPALSIAASLMCMIYALGNVSGAHFNPAVTVAILTAGRDKIKGGAPMAGGYIAVQCLAGACAALVYTHLMGEGFGIGPIPPYGWGHTAIAEIAFTFVLCFVVLNVATTRLPSREMFGLSIASCVTVGGFAIGAISGGSLNPAVSLGIDIGSAVNGLGFGNSLLYSVFEIFGGTLAAGMFYAIRRSEYVKGIYCEEKSKKYGIA